MQQPMPSVPPPAMPVSQPPPPQAMPQMPPVSRAMEATALVPRPQPSRAPLIVALLTLVALGVGAAVFFLIPRPGTLVVNVADSKGAAVKQLEVVVDGKTQCTQAPCVVKEIASGVHEVKVSAAGFEQPAPRAVTIESRKDATLDFALVASKTGGTGFKVAGNQPGVKLVVDGKDIGPLPQDLRDLEPGSHTLKFVGTERYAPLEKTITVNKDEVQDLGSVALKVVKGKAMIQLGTPGAKVYLVNGTNRKEVPQFPIAIDFDPNERWQLEGKKDGFDDFVQAISFDDGQAEKTFVVTLSPKGSAHPVVAAPVQPAQPTQPAQPVAHADPTPKQPPSFVKPETTAAADPTPKKDPPAAAAGGSGEAFLNINSLPASTVVLDGKPLGPTPRLKVSVPPGSHTVLFVNSELSLKKSITVDVKAGETKAAFAKLRD
jgi:serine/threonine-protein kinase